MTPYLASIAAQHSPPRPEPMTTTSVSCEREGSVFPPGPAEALSAVATADTCSRLQGQNTLLIVWASTMTTVFRCLQRMPLNVPQEGASLITPSSTSLSSSSKLKWHCCHRTVIFITYVFIMPQLLLSKHKLIKNKYTTECTTSRLCLRNPGDTSSQPDSPCGVSFHRSRYGRLHGHTLSAWT